MLCASDLACRRGDRLLFRGLALAVQPGDALHIAGPNGIGKSSLLRILAGLLRPYAGSVRHEGAMALIDEHLALDPQLSLAKALAFWTTLEGAAQMDPLPLGLAPLADLPVRVLSTGQRKRAMLARVMASNAAIWLLDEPLNGLDSDWADAAAAAIGLHCAGGGIAIIASHQPLDGVARHGARLTRLALADYAA